MTDSTPTRTVSPWTLLLGTGPRFARDAFGPVLVFYLGWKLVGLTAGILGATVVAVIAWLWERRRERSGMTAAIGLGIALVQAVSGLVTGSTTGYFTPGLVVNGAYGLAFLVSVAVGRPLAGVFARESYPFPTLVRESAAFHRTFSRISLVWAAYLLLRTVVRFAALLQTSVEIFLVINVLTGVPVTLATMTWSVWYGHRRLSLTQDWSPSPRRGARPG
ncbi:MAG TPA: VC0807 family protein [Candidatus Bathyarchaeia archaeon]|nr:VC0807 family protein [Candidatus Bathyarchaeia archaeon]